MSSVAGAFAPLTPALLVETLADLIHVRAGVGVLRIAVDGPVCVDPGGTATRVVERLREFGHQSVLVESRYFCRDASVRLEYGRTDADAFYERWIDVAALEREVLGRAVTQLYLPTLRDPDTNRTTRADYESLAPGAVVVVSGELLLGQGLSFDLSVHLATSSAARRRRTPPALLWTLPAFDRYEAEVSPGEIADVVVAMNDPAHPAIGRRAIRR